MRWIGLIGCVLVGGVVSAIAPAQWDGMQMLHGGAVTNDGAGSAVDVDRDTMIVGVSGFDLPSKLGAGAAVIFRWQGTSWVEETRLTASDAAAGDRFGTSVAIRGNTAVVGAYLHDLPGKTDAGAVYVFQRSGTTWTQVAKLTASNSAANDNLGIAVDLDGDTILAGAWLKTLLASQQGAAYVFTRNAAGAWSQQAQLTDISGAAADWFGNRVALEGDTAVIASPGDDVIFSDRGSVQIYTRSGTTWTRRTALDPGLGGASDFFGSSVSIHNGSVAVGAPGNDVTASGNEGAAYIFTGSGATWSLQQKLTRTDAAVGDSLGNAVAIRGDTVVCGVSNFDGIVGTNQGLGIFFTRSGAAWSASEIFMPNETQAQANFGSAVAMSDEFVAAGATNWSRPGANFSGAAYAFRRANGAPAKTLTLAMPSPQTDANFGNRMAASGNRLVVGAYNEDGSAGANQGAVYVYKFQDDCFVLEQKLLPSGQQDGANFGRSIAIDGTTIVVGAPFEGGGAGVVYVYSFSGTSWTQQASIPSPEPNEANRFGYSVAVSGNRLVVGAPYDDASPTVDVGAAYSYLRSGTSWALEQTFSNSTGNPADLLGWSVAVDGDVVMVGIPGHDTLLQNAGAADFFRWSGTTWLGYNLLPGSGTGDQFGVAVAAHAGLFVVGSLNEYVRTGTFNGTTFTFGAAVTNPNAGFGSVMFLGSSRLVLGLPGYGGAGAALAYTRSGTSLSSLVLHHGGAVDGGDNLGEAIAAIDSAVFAGGGGISLPGGTNQGAVRRMRPGASIEPFVQNVTSSTRYASASSAISAASTGDSLRSEFGALARSGGFSFGTSRATFNIPIQPSLSSNQTVTLTDGANLSTSNSDMTLWNRLSVPFGASATVTAGDLLLDLPSAIDISTNATLSLTPPVSKLYGTATIFPGAALTANALEQGGSFAVFGGIVSASAVNNTAAGRISGYGDLIGSVFNSGAIDVDADMQVVGPLTNNAGGVITVFNGSLTVIGTLLNSGTIIGDFAARSALSADRDPQGMYAGLFEDRATQTIYAKGGIDMDAGARFQPGVGTIIRTAGSFNCGITQSPNFEMLGRTLQLNGRGGSNLEAMSTDRGQTLSALNPNLAGSFPIGTLKIGPGNPSQPTVVTIVDNRDNDALGQASCEAVYVENLVIESGAVLNAPACRVYYKTITNRGTIATLPNVLRLYGSCPADLNNDGLVDDADFSIFVVQYDVLDCADGGMPLGCSADLNSDLLVDDQDFSIFVVAYDALLCP
ncbi:MAG TPA: hypothetical protein VF777_02915 [Phycisphaerales bacterium]